MRAAFRPLPHAMGFSLYFRNGDKYKRSMTIVENTLFKPNPGSWRERLQDFKDRRDMSAYLSLRWGRYA